MFLTCIVVPKELFPGGGERRRFIFSVSKEMEVL